MKRLLIAISMRVAADPQHGEPRDAIARDWWRFLAEAMPGAIPLLLPNAPDMVEPLLEATLPSGLILTGGNDVGSCPERDRSEALALSWMRQRGRPVLGVCRGMQFLVKQLGGQLVPAVLQHHVATRHPVHCTGQDSDAPDCREVNSYHGWQALLSEGTPLRAWAHSEDGAVEGVHAPDQKLLGIMWHPERERPFDPLDLALFARHFTHEEK